MSRDTKFLTPERWDKFAAFFEDGGMEVYAKHVRVRVPDILRPESTKETNHNNYHEATEMVNNVYWRLQSLPADQSALKTQELANRLREVSKAMSIEMLLN